MPTSQADPVEDELGFDPDALRKKYREERDKRLRPEGYGQFVEAAGDFSHYVDDPYVAPGFSREPLSDEVEILILGGGFGGLLAGARLREVGLTDIRIVEKGGDFGGTWYWNRYPGAACDIESYIYLPLLEEMGYIPTEKYARADEIRGYAQAIGRKYSLYDKACFQTQVKSMAWEENLGRWLVKTDRDDEMRAKFVIMANGVLDRPKLPGIPGIASFQGHSFHTSRWDYAYTGGDGSSELVGLRDKRVGLIGTGATGIQCIPALGASAKHLYVFQRTPSSVDVRGNKSTDIEWAQNLQPGWHQQRIENFSEIISGETPPVDLVDDAWTESFRKVIGISDWGDEASSMTFEEITARMELSDFKKMEEVRARVDQLVDDPATAEGLKPYYRLFCKRPCFHDNYLQTYNRDNVTLVDTEGLGVQRITEGGVVVAGKEYELDCLIFATGFEIGAEVTRRAGFEPVGRGGISLAEHWKDGAKSMHGIHTRGFPNCFFVTVGLHNAKSPNFTHVLAELTSAVVTTIKHAVDGGHQTVEVSARAEADWVETLLLRARTALQFQQECTPGYYNNEGKPEEVQASNVGYGGGPEEYFRILREWRQQSELSGLEFDGR